jgi:integrase
VFQRGDGLWCAVLTVGVDELGRRKRRIAYADSKTEALQEMARLRSQALDNTLSEPTRLTLGQYLTRWLEDAVRGSVRPRTFEYYSDGVKRILPHLGGVQIAKLNPAHVQGLLSRLEREGASAHVRRQAFVTLHRACNQALRWGLVRVNPCAAVSRPRIARREMRVLGAEQARAFLEAARGDRHFALFAVLLGCGLRLGECLALSWPDIDFEGGRLTVRRQMVTISGQPAFSEPKSKSAARTVDVPPFVAEALRTHQQRMAEEGHLLTDHLLCFVNETGGPVRRENLRRRSFARILRAAGIAPVRLHDLRHSYATLALQGGVHPRIVQQALGHSQITQTLGTYTHVLPSMGRDAALRLDEILRSREK